MNLFQKLIEIRKCVEYLKKENEGHAYKYVSSSQAVAAVRAKMDEFGVLLVPQIHGQKITEHQSAKGSRQFFTRLTMDYTWINADDPSERLGANWKGQGVDDSEKGLGKALTYAEKYFILKFFQIATDKDDPDAFQAKTERKRSSRKTSAAQPAPSPTYGPTVSELLSCGFSVPDLERLAGGMKINGWGKNERAKITEIHRRVFIQPQGEARRATVMSILEGAK